MTRDAIDQYNLEAYNKWDAESLLPCPNCARTFLPDRLDIHLRSCKADRPLKPPVRKPSNNPKPSAQATPVQTKSAKKPLVVSPEKINFTSHNGDSGGSRAVNQEFFEA